MFSSKYISGVCKHMKTILSYRMGQKLSYKLLFVSSPNIDGFYEYKVIASNICASLLWHPVAYAVVHWISWRLRLSPAWRLWMAYLTGWLFFYRMLPPFFMSLL